MTKKKKTSKVLPISLANDYSPSPFNIVLIRHCESCANVANPLGPFGGHIRKFWRQPLCTIKGVKQAIATGIILPNILKELGLNHNPPFGASILPRAFATAKITSISFDNPITISSTPSYVNSKLYGDSEDGKINDSELYDIPKTNGGAKISRTYPHKIIDPNHPPPDPNSIFRVAYIKETMNPIEPKKKFVKNKGPMQSQNLTSVHHSDSYLLALNHIFSDSDGDSIGRHISMNPFFLENIVGGDENTSPQVRKKIIKSSWDSFEKEVLPSLRSYCQNKNSNCVVLFVHGHLLEDALNRTPDNKKTKGKKRNVWKTARNEKQKRRNLSIHTIGYNDDGTKTIHTNHQLRHLPYVDENLINTYVQKIDIADPMFKCKYKYHKGKAQIVTRANNESKFIDRYPLIQSAGKNKTRRKRKKPRRNSSSKKY